MKRILTVSSNDQGISWGPAVHFLELWNAFSGRFGGQYRILGLVPSWTGLPTIKPPVFKLRRVQVPNIGMLRQAVFDLAAAIWIVLYRKSLIYVRLSYFHPFVIAALAIIGRPFCLEMNGISFSDSHSAGRSVWYKLWTHKQERYLVRKASVVLAVSKSIAKHAREVGAKRVQVVPNSVNPDLFLIRQKPALGPRIRIIYVGTFTSWDGAERIPELARSFPEVEFVTIGDGKRRPTIEEHSPPNVIYIGAVPYMELGKHYAEADAGIVLYEQERHTRVELSSLKVLEYMAAGLPIFSTNVPGQEFIATHAIGRLVRGEDLTRDFSLFLSDLARYKLNVEEYRRTIGQRYRWVHAALITEKAIAQFLL
jgi:glycosyltransferase involved in cell wall biosynthesis